MGALDIGICYLYNVAVPSIPRVEEFRSDYRVIRSVVHEKVNNIRDKNVV